MEDKGFDFKEEIERRFRNSFVNKIYIFPRNLNSSSSSSISSLYSSLNQSNYQLHNQNARTTPPKNRKKVIVANNWISAERKLNKNLSNTKVASKGKKEKRSQIRAIKTNSVFLNSDHDSNNLTNSQEINLKKAKKQGLHKTCQISLKDKSLKGECSSKIAQLKKLYLKTLKRSELFTIPEPRKKHETSSHKIAPMPEAVSLKHLLYEKAKNRLLKSKSSLGKSRNSPRKPETEANEKSSNKNSKHSMLNDVRQIKFKFTNCNEDSISKKMAAKRNLAGKETQSLTIKHIGVSINDIDN